MNSARYKIIRHVLYFWICCIYLLAFSNQSFARPWCSSERLNITEATICNNSELRELDAQLAQVYGTAKAHDKDYGQLDWLKNRRNTCKANFSCIISEYRSRIAVLLERVGVNDTPNARPWCSASRLNLTESTICNTSYLRDFDAELQVAYGQARARKEDFGQLYWLRKERDACGLDESCIAQAYQSRIYVLRNRMQKYRIVSTNNISDQSSVRTRTSIGTLSSTTTRKCSDNQLNELKAVCVISAVGEHACSSTLYKELPSGALTSAGASGVCAAATSHLIDGSIDPSILGLSMASGFLSGMGDSLLESDDSFSAFFGVVFKIGSLAMTAVSIGECFDNVERICR